MRFTKELLSCLSSYKVYGSLGLEVDISVDSRTIKPGQIFLALRGASVDGHNYIDQALSNGASGLIVENYPSNCNVFVLEVPNTLEALRLLASRSRELFSGRVAAVSGSVGKTTTKEMVRSIINDCFASYGNQNSEVGLSINLLKLNHSYKNAVFELGINDPGEMDILASLARPHVAAITWISDAHTKGLGDVNGVAREKSKIFYPGCIAITPDQTFFTNPTFGYSNNDVNASEINISSGKTTFKLNVYGDSDYISMNVESLAFVNSALAASAIAHHMGISLNEIKVGLEKFVPVDGRFKRKKMKSGLGEMIDDSYNASPESMKVAIDAFDKLESLGGPKVVILGDMLDLGDDTLIHHQNLKNELAKKNFEKIIFVGEHMKFISDLENSIYFSSWQGALKYINDNLSHGSLLLLKASNSIGLKNIVDRL